MNPTPNQHPTLLWEALPHTTEYRPIRARYKFKGHFLRHLNQVAPSGVTYTILATHPDESIHNHGAWTRGGDHRHHFLPKRAGTNSQGEPVQEMRCAGCNITLEQAKERGEYP